MKLSFPLQSSLPLFVYETLTWNDQKEKTVTRMATNGGHVSFTDAISKFDDKFERERQKYHRQLKGTASSSLCMCVSLSLVLSVYLLFWSVYLSVYL